LKTERQILIQHDPYILNELYEKYSGMLLGYISEVVKDQKLAEQHLVSIYNYIPGHINELKGEGINTWCQLQRIAKKHLGLYDGQPTNTSISGHDLSNYKACNRFLNLMTEEQKEVFCNVYYRGKTIAELSKQLNRSEGSIRVLLKEAFVIIKKR